MSIAGKPGRLSGSTTQKNRPPSKSRSRSWRSCAWLVVCPTVYVRSATTLPFWVAASVWSWTGPNSKVALTPKLLEGTAAVIKRDGGG